MKIALLGTDPALLRLAAAAKGEGHEIVWLGDVRPADAVAISELVPNLTDRATEWELLLDRELADAVLVGRGHAPSELRVEQLKRLAAEAAPLLVVHPVCESVLPYYEVDMARRESGGLVRHYNPLAAHPIVREVAEWVRDGHPTIGPIHQLTCERHLSDGTRDNVLAHVARDSELLAETAGDIRRVSAIGPRANDSSYASLQVQMTSTSEASLRWSVGSLAATDYRLEMGLIGERGTVAVRAFAKTETEGNFGHRDAWELETTSAGQHDRRTLEPYDSALVAIRQLAEAVVETNSERRARKSTWETATRAMEVADAVALSLEKERTIEVHQQHLTEQLAFRGTMAALGCGLLLVGFAAIVVVTLLGGAEGKDRPLLLPSWPMALLAVLAFFLLLQAVPLFAAKKQRRADGGDDRESA